MDCLPFRYNDASYKHKLESAVNLDLRENRAWRADRDSSSRLPSNTHNNSYTYHPDIPTAVPTTLKQPMNKSAIISAIPASTRPVPPSMSNKHNNSYEKIEIDLDGLSSRQQY
jgi:hypothetical protein